MIWTRLRRPLFAAAIRAITLGAVLAPALAHAAAPATPSLRKSTPAWLGYLVIALLLIVVMFISLLPSKRSHQN